MATEENARRRLRTATAVGVVVLYVVGLSLATWLFFTSGSQILLGVLVWIGWGLFPGLAAFVALRARSDLTVTAAAILAPTMIELWLDRSNPYALARSLYPLAIAAGIFAGIWVAKAVMRRSGRIRTAVGFGLGCIVGVVVAFLVLTPLGMVYSGGGPGSRIP
jgi:ABC-type proline/glycine betaine transport system permease subunit